MNWSNFFSWLATGISAIATIILFVKRKTVETIISLLVAIFSVLALIFNTQNYEVKGKVSLEDGSTSENVVITFSKNDKSIKSVSPNKNGDYALQLPNGSYRIRAQLQGFKEYKSKDEKIIEESVVEPIFLKVNPKKVKVTLLDKKGMPYRNLRMALVKSNQMGTVEFFTTDSKGRFETSTLEYSKYELVLAEPSKDNIFLWNLGLTRLGNFQILARKEEYIVRIPRIVYLNSNNQLGGQQINAPKYNYVAQYIPNIKVNFCGLGIGMFGTGLPDQFQIRTSENQAPSMKILYSVDISNQPSESVGAVSSGNEGVFANFCKKYKSPLSWPKSGGWLVVFFKSNVPQVGVTGEVDFNYPPTLSSNNGKNWEVMPLPMNWTKIWTYAAE